MPPRAKDIEDSPAMDILNELLNFVDAKQAIPNENALFDYVIAPKKYAMTKGAFRYWFGRLQLAGYISVEPLTRAIRVHKRRIIETE